MDDEKLISLVEANPCLYNKYNKQYKSLDVKRNVWNQIAIEMGSTDKQCIKRWTVLRDRYTRECRKMNAPYDSSASHDRPWPHFDQMDFLKQHVASKHLRSSINIYENGISETSGTMTVPVPPHLSAPFPADPLQASTSPSPSPSPIPRSAKKRKSELDKAFVDAVKVFCEDAKERRAQQGNEAVFGFTQMMAAKLSNMSAAKQARTMLRLHQILLEAELEQY